MSTAMVVGATGQVGADPWLPYVYTVFMWQQVGAFFPVCDPASPCPDVTVAMAACHGDLTVMRAHLCC